MQSFIEFIRAYPDAAQCIGVVGFMIYISSFFSVQCGRLCGNGIVFPVLQVVAATCVLISLASAYNLASFMIQTSYIAIGLFGIVLRIRNGRGKASGLTKRARALELQSPKRISAGSHPQAALFQHRTKQSDPTKSRVA